MRQVVAYYLLLFGVLELAVIRIERLASAICNRFLGWFCNSCLEKGKR